MKPHATSINQRLLRGQAPSYERLQARLAEARGDAPEAERVKRRMDLVQPAAAR